MSDGHGIYGIWDRSRYGWHLYDDQPVVGSAENLRAYVEMHAPSNPQDLEIRPFRLEDAGAMATVSIANRLPKEE